MAEKIPNFGELNSSQTINSEGLISFSEEQLKFLGYRATSLCFTEILSGNDSLTTSALAVSEDEIIACATASININTKQPISLEPVGAGVLAFKKTLNHKPSRRIDSLVMSLEPTIGEIAELSSKRHLKRVYYVSSWSDLVRAGLTDSTGEYIGEDGGYEDFDLPFKIEKIGSPSEDRLIDGLYGCYKRSGSDKIVVDNDRYTDFLLNLTSFDS